jgi:hypothetical protein
MAAAADAVIGINRLREFPTGEMKFEAVRKNKACLYVDKTVPLCQSSDM